MTEPILEVRDLDVCYGASQALFGVTLSVPKGGVLAVLGTNGAGKSTLARAVSGLVPTHQWAGVPRRGGRDRPAPPPHPQARADLHPRGAWHLSRPLGHRQPAHGRGPGAPLGPAPAIERAIEHFPVLGNRRTQRAGSLSGGEQQMLALARALAVSPKVIIADEMSLGLAPLVTESVFEGLEQGLPLGDHARPDRAVRPPGLGHGDRVRDPDQGAGGLVGAGRRGRSRGDRPLSGRGGGDPRRHYGRVTIMPFA